MSKRIVFVSIAALFLLSCNDEVNVKNEAESKVALNQALDVFTSFELAEHIRIDSSLALTNKALNINDENVDALNHKATLLFQKKDARGLIEIADKLIELRPDQPSHIGRKAVYLDLANKPSQADKYYKQAFRDYEKLLKVDSLNFDLWIEYVSLLEVSKDTIAASSTLETMKSMGFTSFQKAMLSNYKEETTSMTTFKKFWSGEIGYDDITK